MTACAKGKTRLEGLRQAGSSKLVFPRTYGSGIDAVMVNTAGGITGGDDFALEAHVGEDATLTLTTQAAERAYRAQPAEVGRVTTKMTVAAGGRLNWLPQELILFERCNLHRQLSVDLQPGARLLLVEPLVFGRVAMGEGLHDACFRDRIRVTRGGKPIYLDGMDFSGDVTARLARPTIADGATAMASVVLVDPDAGAHLSAIRSHLPDTAGASLLADDLMVIRHLAPDSLALRRHLIPVLEHLNQSPLPMSWRL